VTLDREVEALKVEVRHLGEGQKDLKEEIRLLRSEMKAVNEFVTEARYGKTYLLWLLTAAATLGALVDYLCRLIKLY
jgi:hypothetical protein